MTIPPKKPKGPYPAKRVARPLAGAARSARRRGTVPPAQPPTTQTGRRVPGRERDLAAQSAPVSKRKISRISRLLSEAGLRLKKGLGQNFLVNQGALEKIAKSVEATKSSFVLEIGSGLGNLTELLARHAGHVIAVELDERFRPLHSRELKHFENLGFLYMDFMEVDLRTVIPQGAEKDIRIVGNIPYHLTSPILFKLMASSVPIASICLLMQREVGVRLAAAPETKNYGILAAKVRTRFDVHLDFTISPGSFLPPPKVHSSLVRFTPRTGGALIEDAAERQGFFHFVDACFAQRRKMIGKSIEAATHGLVTREAVDGALERIGLEKVMRAEQLAPEQLLDLFRALGSPQLPAIRKDYEEK